MCYQGADQNLGQAFAQNKLAQKQLVDAAAKVAALEDTMQRNAAFAQQRVAELEQAHERELAKLKILFTRETDLKAELTLKCERLKCQEQENVKLTEAWAVEQRLSQEKIAASQEVQDLLRQENARLVAQLEGPSLNKCTVEELHEMKLDLERRFLERSKALEEEKMRR